MHLAWPGNLAKPLSLEGIPVCSRIEDFAETREQFSLLIVPNLAAAFLLSLQIKPLILGQIVQK